MLQMQLLTRPLGWINTPLGILRRSSSTAMSLHHTLHECENSENSVLYHGKRVTLRLCFFSIYMYVKQKPMIAKLNKPHNSMHKDSVGRQVA